MGDLAEVQDELAAEGIGIAAISLDEPADSQALAERLGLHFPLLSDPNSVVTAAYGVQMVDGPYAVPATFVVRTDLTISWSYIGIRAIDRPEIEVVQREAARSALTLSVL